MKKVQVVALKRDCAQVVDSLYRFGAIEIEETKLPLGFSKPMDSFQTVASALVKLREMEDVFKVKAADKSEPKFPVLEELASKFRKLPLHRFDALVEELNLVERNMSDLNVLRQQLTPLRFLKADSKLLFSQSISSALFEFKSAGAKNDAIITAGKAIRGISELPHQVYTFEENGKLFVLASFSKQAEQKVLDALKSRGGQQLQIPKIEGSFAYAFNQLAKRNFVLTTEKNYVLKELGKLRELFGSDVLSLRKGFEKLSVQSQLPAKFSETQSLHVVNCWIPAKAAPAFADFIESHGAAVEILKSSVHDAPSKFSNPGFAQPFEFLVKFFSIPKAFEFDPTLLIAFTFPLFFGMIIGDVGYGALVAIASVIIGLKAKHPAAKQIAGMMFVCALSAIVFGFIFGEFFGFDSIFGWMPLGALLHRTDAQGLSLLIQLSILFGVIHLAMGFILGILLGLKERHYKHAAGKFAWLLLEISVVSTLTLGANLDFFKLFQPAASFIGLPVSIGLVAVGLVLLVVSEGFMPILELPTLFSNIFSYLRIMAIGVSGVILLEMINGLLGAISFQKVMAWDFGAILFAILVLAIFLIAQVFAFALALFEASIQSLRLHYVEFFSKFYGGGGRLFKPLRDEEN